MRPTSAAVACAAAHSPCSELVHPTHEPSTLKAAKAAVLDGATVWFSGAQSWLPKMPMMRNARCPLTTLSCYRGFSRQREQVVTAAAENAQVPATLRLPLLILSLTQQHYSTMPLSKVFSYRWSSDTSWRCKKLLFGPCLYWLIYSLTSVLTSRSSRSKL